MNRENNNKGFGKGDGKGKSFGSSRGDGARKPAGRGGRDGGFAGKSKSSFDGKKDDRFSSDKPARKRVGDRDDSKGGFKKPYSPRGASSDRPTRSGDSSDRPTRSRTSGGDASGGFKKPYSPRGASSDRPTRGGDSDRPTRNRTSGGDDSRGFKKPYSSEDRPTRGRSTGGDASGGFKKPYSPRGASSDRPTRSGDSSDRPTRNRTSGGDDSRGFKKPYSSEDRPTRSRSASGDDKGGFKKPYSPRGTSSDRPTRDSDSGSRNTRSYGDEKKDSGAFKRPYEKKPYERKPYARKSSAEPKRTAADDGLTRLNKFIANTGVCSRREADELITAGAVQVNGKIVTEMGMKIDPMVDIVHYGGDLLRSEKLRYVLVNKPKDYITTTEDPQDRKTIMELVKDACKERIYPVGRLDRATTGLLLLTNDGELTKRLTHPRYNIKKMYHVELDKNLKQSDFETIKNGFELSDGPIEVDEISYVGETKKEVGIEIHSGKNRIVRRIFENFGYEIHRLDRVYFAGLTKKDLPRARWRHLTQMEINMLKMLTGSKVADSEE